MAKNSLMVLVPYVHGDTWVFDDPSTGLVKEPFVCGIPEMIDFLVQDIPDAEKGFRLLFSSSEFPGFQFKLDWVREEMGGNWYALSDLFEGWLCPALFKYFDAAPEHLYIRAEPINHK